MLWIAWRGLTDVLVPDALIESIRSYVRKTSTGSEQGGLLLGYRKEGAVQLHSATFPGHWDHASPTLFRRSARGHRMGALREWVRSMHTVDWVGEWHTHPGGAAQPSFIDLRNWASLTRHTGKPMTFFIFADTQHYVGLQEEPGRKVIELEVIECGAGACLYSRSAPSRDPRDANVQHRPFSSGQ